MRYVGSKRRIAKEIIPIITKNLTSDKWYIEPFVGGGNLITEVNHKKKIGYDVNPLVIKALRLIRDNPESLPKDSSTYEIDYKYFKQTTKDDELALKGYYGFSLSFGGKYFGGVCRDKQGKRDFVSESFRNSLKQSKKLQDVKLGIASYDKIFIYPNAIVYCDPPYQGTLGYNVNFSHDKFWQWVREKSLISEVFVSEYEAPDDFECLWEKEITSTLDLDTGSKKNTERLFKYKG